MTLPLLLLLLLQDQGSVPGMGVQADTRHSAGGVGLADFCADVHVCGLMHQHAGAELQGVAVGGGAAAAAGRWKAESQNSVAPGSRLERFPLLYVWCKIG